MKVKIKLKRTISGGKKKRYEYMYKTDTFSGEWKSMADHQAFRDKVRQKWSGWSIVVYGPVK